MKKILSIVWIILGSVLIASADGTNAPLKLRLESPMDYQIFQRATRDQGKVIIAGAILPESKEALPLDTIQARLIGESYTSNALSGKWQKLPFDPRVSGFRGELAVPAGGWYKLEIVVLRQNQPVLSNTVEHVGVGEIFVIAGQSNSANYGEQQNRTLTGLVVAYNGTNWQLAADPEPGAGGKKGSFMPIFGDAMVKQFNVPVGIVPMGIGSTSVREWLPAGVRFSGLPPLTRNVVTVGPGQWESTGKIFDTFAGRMKQLGPNGFRAVLWHQGESDANQANPQNTLAGALYRQDLETIIADSRQEIGWNAPWFVAQVSYHNPDDTGTPDIPAAQKAVCDDGFAFPGPDTDVLTGKMREKNGEGIHLSAEGLKAHAQLWMDRVAPWLERQLDEPDGP